MNAMNTGMMPTLKMARATRYAGAEAVIDLSRTRRWYADDAPPAPDAPGKPADAPSASDSKGLDTLTPEELRAYIKELRQENKDRRTRLDAFEKAQADAEAARKAGEEKRLTEEGQHKTLADQRAAEIERLKVFEKQVAELTEAIKKRNTERIKSLPEPMRKLVPVDYDPHKLALWLDENKSVLTNPVAPSLNAGQKSTGDGKQTAKQIIKRVSY